jgi:phage-related protein
MAAARKPLFWMGLSKVALKTFPDEVQDVMGYALDFAQQGKKHPDAKPRKGFGGAGVLEIIDDYDGDTYRAVYTVKFAHAVYVLHCFQKKSKRGIATAKQDLDVIESRLKRAREHYTAWSTSQKGD